MVGQLVVGRYCREFRIITFGRITGGWRMGWRVDGSKCSRQPTYLS